MDGASLPAGYHSVNPYINVGDADGSIAFLIATFGGVEHGERELTPDGHIGHAGVRISEASEAMPARPGVLFVYAADVDATYRTALSAGAVSIIEPTDQA